MSSEEQDTARFRAWAVPPPDAKMKTVCVIAGQADSDDRVLVVLRLAIASNTTRHRNCRSCDRDHIDYPDVTAITSTAPDQHQK